MTSIPDFFIWGEGGKTAAIMLQMQTVGNWVSWYVPWTAACCGGDRGLTGSLRKPLKGLRSKHLVRRSKFTSEQMLMNPTAVPSTWEKLGQITKWINANSVGIEVRGGVRRSWVGKVLVNLHGWNQHNVTTLQHHRDTNRDKMKPSIHAWREAGLASQHVTL